MFPQRNTARRHDTPSVVQGAYDGVCSYEAQNLQTMKLSFNHRPMPIPFTITKSGIRSEPSENRSGLSDKPMMYPMYTKANESPIPPIMSLAFQETLRDLHIFRRPPRILHPPIRTCPSVAEETSTRGRTSRSLPCISELPCVPFYVFDWAYSNISPILRLCKQYPTLVLSD